MSGAYAAKLQARHVLDFRNAVKTVDVALMSRRAAETIVVQLGGNAVEIFVVGEG